jgi:subtilisin-like proprotein convertase family protein
LELEVTHTWVGDLRIILEHGGTETVVWNRAGGGQDDIQQTFPLDAFAGVDATGSWTLRVTDNASRDTGTLVRWALLVQL